MRTARLRASVIALLLTGLAWAAVWAVSLATFAITLAIATLAVALASRRATRARLERIGRRLARPGTRGRLRIAAVVAVSSAVYLVATATLQGRSFLPIWSDEHSYLLQARMLVEGRVTLPPHPLYEFFDTFHVLMQPVYASMYPVGTPLMIAPAVWLGLPTWVMPLLACALSAAVLYLLVTEVLDGLAGLAAAVLLTGGAEWRHVSLTVLSQPFMVLLMLLAVWALVRWSRTGRGAWAALAGAATGWALVTRPIEGLALVAALAVGLALTARGQAGERLLTALAIAAAAAAPFVAWQAWTNRQVTGSWGRAPYLLYHAQHYPELTLGFPTVDSAAPILGGPRQKRLFAEQVVRPAALAHQPDAVARDVVADRLPWTARRFFGLDPLVAALVPVGILGVWYAGRLALALIAPLVFMVYLFYPLTSVLYAVVAFPSLIVLAVSGWRVCETTWSRRLGIPRIGGLVVVSTATLIQLPEVDRRVVDARFDPPEVGLVHRTLAHLPHQPAIVLFRYDDSVRWQFEPVYNLDRAWPDDAVVIRAHDLGARNAALVEYYARRQPARHLYRYDRADGRLTDLGKITDLWRKDRNDP